MKQSDFQTEALVQNMESLNSDNVSNFVVVLEAWVLIWTVKSALPRLGWGTRFILLYG